VHLNRCEPQEFSVKVCWPYSPKWHMCAYVMLIQRRKTLCESSKEYRGRKEIGCRVVSL